MIYAFEKCKSFSEDARHIRFLLNNTVDFHVQAVVHHVQAVSPAVLAGIRPTQTPTKLSWFWPLSRILAIVARIQ
jgi:hypothetical protein